MVQDLVNGYVTSATHNGITTIEFFHPQSNSLPHRLLVDLANERGGHDNITVVLISVPADFKFAAQKKKADWLPWLLGGLAGVVSIVALGSAFSRSNIRRARHGGAKSRTSWGNL